MSCALSLGGLPEANHGIQHLTALLALAMAMAALLIGVAGPDPRLLVEGVPLSTVLFVAAAGLVVGIPCLPGTRKTVVLALVPVALLALTLLVSLDFEAGASKVLNLLASVLVAAVLMAASVQRIGTESTLRWIIVLMVSLLAGAIAYKLRYGFFDRQVLFLMNGPIVFARLMGLGCLFCIVALRGWARLALALVFFVGVLWTASKGPILALLLAIAIYAWILGSRRERLVFLGLIMAVLFGVAVNYERLSELEPLGRIFLIFDALSSPGGAGWDSVGSRMLLLHESIDILQERPLGIGVGSWPLYTGIRWSAYPHNLFLELWNEGGLALGTVAALPYFLFLFRRPDAWWLACIFLMLCQQVSGDLLDSRYWLTFSIVGLVCRAEGVMLRSAVRGADSEHG